MYILVLVFFCGLIAGAWLFWQNSQRLGLKVKPGLLVGITIAYLALFFGVTVAFTHRGEFSPTEAVTQALDDRQDDETVSEAIDRAEKEQRAELGRKGRQQRRLIDYSMTVVAFGISFFYYQPQKARYRQANLRGLKDGRFWRRGLLAGVVSWLILFVIGFVGVMAARGWSI